MTLALYSVIFERDPVLRAASSATAFVKDRSRDELLQMADELELELGHPSVPVREALESIATEEQCREYLKAFVAHVRGHL